MRMTSTILALLVALCTASAVHAADKPAKDDKEQIRLLHRVFVGGCMEDKSQAAEFQQVLENLGMQFHHDDMCTCTADKLMSDPVAVEQFLHAGQLDDPAVKRLIGGKALAYAFHCVADNISAQLTSVPK
ncbi:hypothetical protein IGB42_02529 [Andreprevotia sp. IGB-42]|uniref:hypothetical protein n=1 Tax=Andreprevotia sp. IGB-42 TaxID=2497473 RepID=UPI00135BDB71|nr:hypothetical protein [Andreprevotia sp. IGB-42]KAF0813129.1 hypothetical protein IGB42_02529 [Andreprevotia sp. IGB-42]